MNARWFNEHLVRSTSDATDKVKKDKMGQKIYRRGMSDKHLTLNLAIFSAERYNFFLAPDVHYIDFAKFKAQV